MNVEEMADEEGLKVQRELDLALMCAVLLLWCSPSCAPTPPPPPGVPPPGPALVLPAMRLVDLNLYFTPPFSIRTNL
jgi:hypothetical protein